MRPKAKFVDKVKFMSVNNFPRVNFVKIMLLFLAEILVILLGI
jgi:type III secretory pathway lipoprotein EscJ